MNPSLASQSVEGSVTNALATAFLSSLGGGKSFFTHLLVYYVFLWRLGRDCRGKSGTWKKVHALQETQFLISVLWQYFLDFSKCPFLTIWNSLF
ncbi:hypothetical protein BLX87_22205 [Bacillus sp. VT-16-64]|nr:hypothetical protein BLX87_22205 [Bacillus sp. VT-16-64]